MRQGRKKIVICVFLVLCCIFIVQCVKKEKEEAPFFDGLYLKYDVIKTSKTRYDDMLKTEGIKERSKITYRLEDIGDEQYRVVKTDYNEKRRMSMDEEFAVDIYGKVVSREREYKYGDTVRRVEDYEYGKFSKIWIPVQGLEKGDVFNGTLTVTGRAKWMEWDVVIVTDALVAPGAEWYYDAETGFFVGMKAGIGVKFIGSEERDEVLSETNAAIDVAR